MKFTDEQVKKLNQMREVTNAVIASKPEIGLGRWCARQEAIAVLVALHNHQMAIDNAKKKAS